MSAIALAAILWLTLRPNSELHPLTAAGCCSVYDVVFNILLFLPLGAGLALLGLRPRFAIGVGVLASVAIELAQRWWVQGRFASIYDVAANAAGCGLGVLIVARWERRGWWWPRVSPPLAVVVVLAWFLGGYLAQPAIPGPSPWMAEWAPAALGMPPFPGRILEVRLQGVSLPDGPVSDLPKLRARLTASRKTRFEVTIVTGPPAAGERRLVEIVVGEGTVPFLVLAQEGGTLLAYQRTGLSWVGLRGPSLRMEGVLPHAAGDTVRILVEATRRHVRLMASHAGVERESVLRLSPELYFSALFYRATDGTLWWRMVPAMLSFLLLGLTLATRPKLLVVAGLASLFLSAVGGGCAFPGWPVALSALASAAAGRALANRIGMFRG